MSFSERGHFSLCQCRGPAGDCFPAGPKSTLSSTFYPPVYSDFKESIGLALAAFQLCMPTVRTTIASVISPASPKNQPGNPTLYG